LTTALGIIKSAMRKNGALTKGDTPDSDEAADGLEMLNDLLASLSNDSLIVYARTVEGFSLVAGTASYTIGASATFNTTRPIKIVSAYVRSGTIDYPLEIISDEQYAAITLKSTSGTPEYLNYTNAFPQATINLYPKPAAADTLYLVTEKELSSFTLAQTVSLPPGWKRMLTYNLAVEMAPEYGQQVSPEVFELAKESKAAIKYAVMTAKPMQWDSGVSSTDNIYGGWNT